MYKNVLIPCVQILVTQLHEPIYNFVVRRYIPSKRLLIFNGLEGAIFQKIELLSDRRIEIAA
jgi:hypothetical protein